MAKRATWTAEQIKTMFNDHRVVAVEQLLRVPGSDVNQVQALHAEIRGADKAARYIGAILKEADKSD